jgi:hypothetical protein
MDRLGKGGRPSLLSFQGRTLERDKKTPLTKDKSVSIEIIGLLNPRQR